MNLIDSLSSRYKCPLSATDSGCLGSEGDFSSANSGHDPINVVIVLAVFNGARYLREQIESIREQSWRHWRLVIRDDGSSDESRALIKSLIAEDSRIQLLADHTHLGCSKAYDVLIDAAMSMGATYIAFADQDDVWERDKVLLSLKAIREAESRNGSEAAVLVHSDLAVVDSRLRVIHKSFMEYTQIRHVSSAPIKNLLVENFVTGSTIVVNRSLLRVATPFPVDIVFPDWWLAMCAAATGTIVFIPKQMVMYRRHDHNMIGAHVHTKRWWYFLWHRTECSRAVARAIVQVRQLHTRLRERQAATVDALFVVQKFCDVFSDRSPGITRAIRLLRSNIRRQKWLEWIGWVYEASLLTQSKLRESRGDST